MVKGTKSQPQRTCIGCREVKAKPQLIRIVRAPGGEVEVDVSWKRPGRGAYLCPVQECWQKGLKGERLHYALRGGMSPQSLERLQEYATTLPRSG